MPKKELIVVIILLLLASYANALYIDKERIANYKESASVQSTILSSIFEEPSVEKERLVLTLEKEPFLLNTRIALRGGEVIHEYGKLKDKVVVEIPKNKLDDIAGLSYLTEIREDKRVKALLEDSIYQIKADYAWGNGITGQGVTVCVVDTGIDYNHPDLEGKVIAQYDFSNMDDDAMDDQGHGTHCAGIIASKGAQYRGVSHDVALMGAKVLDYIGSGYSSDVVLGIDWCVDQGADVISLSLGEGLYPDTCDDNDMAQAVNNAFDNGVVVVCAAGNDGDQNNMVAPACASKCIAVGSLDKNDNIASYSDGGVELDVVAPGGDMFGGTNYAEIVSTFSTEVANDPGYCMIQDGYQCYDPYFVVQGTRYIRAAGTSMATPHVAGAAALLLEENPSLTPEQIKTLLETTADDLGEAGWDNVYGWGKINMQNALENIPVQPAELIVDITEPAADSTFNIDDTISLEGNVICYGGDGCGFISAYAQFCRGIDCSDFVNIDQDSELSTADDNPIELGYLSGQTVETPANLIFDARQYMICLKRATKGLLIQAAL